MKRLDPEGGPSINVTIRFTREEIETIDLHVEEFRDEHGATRTRSGVIRAAALRATQPTVGKKRKKCWCCGMVEPSDASIRHRVEAALAARANDPKGLSGYSRAQLAEASGVDLAIVENLNRTCPERTTLIRIANALVRKGF
jgi:hypothetical protein